MESTPEQIAKVRELFANGKPIAIKAENGEVIAYGCYACDKPAIGWFRRFEEYEAEPFQIFVTRRPVGDPIPACAEHLKDR